jgi:hypothetical protein
MANVLQVSVSIRHAFFEVVSSGTDGLSGGSSRMHELDLAATVRRKLITTPFYVNHILISHSSQTLVTDYKSFINTLSRHSVSGTFRIFFLSGGYQTQFIESLARLSLWFGAVTLLLGNSADGI